MERRWLLEEPGCARPTGRRFQHPRTPVGWNARSQHGNSLFAGTSLRTPPSKGSVPSRTVGAPPAGSSRAQGASSARSTRGLGTRREAGKARPSNGAAPAATGAPYLAAARTGRRPLRRTIPGASDGAVGSLLVAHKGQQGTSLGGHLTTSPERAARDRRRRRREEQRWSARNGPLTVRRVDPAELDDQVRPDPPSSP